MQKLQTIRMLAFLIGTGVAVSIALFFGYALRPVNDGTEPIVIFEVQKGDGFRKVADNLTAAGLIRSPIAFKFYGILNGSAGKIKPGFYGLNFGMSGREILRLLVEGSKKEKEITIPEGFSIYDIDDALSANGITRRGEFSVLAESAELEGILFPDTYKFFTGSEVAEVMEKMTETFKRKAASLLPADPKQFKEKLILASLLEKEVIDQKERQIAAGILEKRVAQGIPLQVDATICYIKEQLSKNGSVSCYPLTSLDFKKESPYNTYLHRGWPPKPIGNPGLESIKAAMNPASSRYWFYLTDPASKQTIFSQTLDEHNSNRVKYLKAN